MSKIILIVSWILILPVQMFGDPGYWDFFEISVDDENYYFRGLSRGVLKSDRHYYSAEGKYLYDVDSVLRDFFRGDSVTLYKNLDSINVRKFSAYSYGNNYIYNFTGAVKFDSDYLLKNYKLTHAYNVHSSDYTLFTKELKDEDNAWIQKNEIEKLFEIRGRTEDDDYRTYEFFGIKGRTSEAEKEKVKTSLEKVLYDGTQFHREISKLYQRKIIMLCVCWE